MAPITLLKANTIMTRICICGTGLCLLLNGSALADIIITEVIPGVSTDGVDGDTVELYNTGPGAVDLTDWVLTDIDPGSVESDVLTEGTFAPAGISLPTLASGEFAVVIIADTTGTAGYVSTNYGLRITASLTSPGTSIFDDEYEQLLLVDDFGNPIDFVAWSVGAGSPSSTTDTIEDLEALTLPTAGYGLTPGNAAWDADDDITDLTHYRTSTVDFSGFDGVSSYGNGAIRRVSTNGVFNVGSPDGPLQWEAIERHEVRLGNPSDDVVGVGTIEPLKYADDLAAWLAMSDFSSHPDRRIARDESGGEFQPPNPMDLSDWESVLALALAGDWDDCFDAANDLNYEVVEFLDTASDETFHILRDRNIPGEADYIGQGIFVFHNGAGVRDYFVLQAPHPRWDTDTMDQTALAIPQVFPRVAMISGTHRRNEPVDSLCDGSHSNGDPYRISDVAHHPDNFFHRTHRYLHSNLTDMVALQFHGFCCPGSAPYGSVTDDCIISNGHNASPGVNELTTLLAARIEAQNFLADGTDLTTVAVYPDDTSVLGARTNVQGRITNGVSAGDECDTYASGASGDFVHVEQDPDVRDEPQHVITALIEALDLLESVPVELDAFSVE